jgi:hypothetical protein
MILETSTRISSNQALFDERSKSGGSGGSGDIICNLIDFMRLEG